MVSAPFVIHEIFRVVAAERGDEVAVKQRGEALSYRELDRRSDALAAAIHGAGVEPGAKVAMMAVRSLDAIVAMLGILKAGCAYVPIDEKYPDAVIRDYLKQSDVAVIVLTDRDQPSEAMRALKRLSVPRRGDPGAVPPAVAVEPNSPAYVMFTSGSTGEPKGVVVPHRGVVRLVRNTNYISIREQDNILLLAAMTFDASTLEIWGALLNGATLVVYPESIFDPNVLRETIRDNAVSFLFLTTTLFHLMVRRAIDALEGVSVLVVGGEVMQPDAVKRWFLRYPSTTVVNGYGPTENTTFTTCHVMTAASPLGETVPIGAPISGTSVHILGPDRRPVERGEVGELYTGGLGVALGYLNSPEATEAAFVPDPADPSARLYRTGDLVRELPDGTLDFVDRVDSLVKVRGFRVSMAEVQKKVCEVAGVENAVVDAEDDGSGSKCLIAYVQSGGDARRLKQLIKSSLEEKLPPYMLPSAIHVCPAFPVNKNGKVDKGSMRRAIAPQGE